MNIIKKTHASLFAVLMVLSLAIFSCDSGSKSVPTGEGGPDVSPETVADSNAVADKTAEETVTDTSSSESSAVVVESESNTVIEGSGDTVSSSSEGDTTNLDVLLPATDTTVTTTDEGTTSDTTVSGTSDTTASSSTDDTTTSSGGDETSGTSTTADTTGTTTGSDTTTTAGTTDTTTTVTTTNPDELIQEVATEEVTPKVVPDYELVTSDGKWFVETPGTVTDDATANSTRAKIADLRAQIKDIIQQQAKKAITRKDAVAKIKSLRAQIAELRSKVGNGGNKIEGIYTYWAYQDLFLKINKGESGWYRLIVIAKNKGTLPDSYDRFSFNVTNASGDIIGSFKVKASEKVYNRGSIDFYLESPASETLNIVWTNDYYVEGKYDANINIKKVALKKIKEPKQNNKKNGNLQGDQYSSMDGRWFFDKQCAYTHWSGQEIGYTFKNLEEGVYEIEIEVMNEGTLPLPKDYKEFKLDVESDYDSADMAIDASDRKWTKGKINMNFPEGTSTVYLTWTNDSYKEGSYDANIMIKSISVKKVKESNLTAYLLKTKPGNKIFILAAFLVISGVLAGIYIRNRSASSES